MTIDYNADIRWEQVLEVERQANRYIWEDHPCRVTFPPRRSGRPSPYRSKKALTGAVRLTEFPGGRSVRLLRHPCLRQRTGGAGEISLLPEAPGRGAAGAGVRRPGHGHLCRSWQQNRSIGQQLSVKPGDTSAAVERQGREVLSLKTRCAGLEEELFRLLAGSTGTPERGAAGAAQSGGETAPDGCATP